MPTYLRPTTQDDADRGIVPQDRVGSLRETLANPPGANLEDVLTLGSNLQTAALEAAPAIGAAVAATAAKVDPRAAAAMVSGAAAFGTSVDLQARKTSPEVPRC